MDRSSPRYIVINHEEQFTVWRSGLKLPRGWREIGRTGTKEECLNYIEEVWTDMKPNEFLRVKEGKLPR